PTRNMLGSLALLGACAIELRRFDETLPQEESLVALAMAAAAPWLSWLFFLLPSRAQSHPDRSWRSFRNRFGVVWALRLREQFNHAARNAGVNVELTWQGLRRADGNPPSDEEQITSNELLAALMRRFGIGNSGTVLTSREAHDRAAIASNSSTDQT